jgi:N-acetylmuramoyl-L-alanine amidase
VKKFFIRGIIFVLTALFSFFNNTLIIYPMENKKLKLEALDAQIIMDNLVRESEDKRISGFEISYDDAQMLMKIAMAEAGADGKHGMAMVMAVVLNRVNNENFPNSIEEVIFQEHQFSPIADGRYEKAEPDVECHLALAEIERGEYDTVDALYFENASQSWQASNCEYLGTVGHHRFYK